MEGESGRDEKKRKQGQRRVERRRKEERKKKGQVEVKGGKRGTEKERRVFIISGRLTI